MKFSLALVALVASTHALPQRMPQQQPSSTCLTTGPSPTQDNGQGVSPSPYAQQNGASRPNVNSSPAPSANVANGGQPPQSTPNPPVNNSPAPSANVANGGQPPQNTAQPSATQQGQPQAHGNSPTGQNEGQANGGRVQQSNNANTPSSGVAPSGVAVKAAVPDSKAGIGAAAGSGNSPSPSSPAISSPSPNPAFSAPAAEISSIVGSAPSSSCGWDFVLTCANHVYEVGSTCMTPMAQAGTNCFSDTTCAAAIGSNAPTCATCFTSIGKQQFLKMVYTERSNSAVKPIFDAMVSFGVCDSRGAEASA